jgi:hypothetical protein
MNDNQGLLSSGLARLMRNKRYIVWFWLLNLILALFGTIGFAKSAGAILGHSLAADRLTQGFHLGTFINLLSLPEFPHLNSITGPAVYFAVLFFLFTALFLPGVFAGYASTYRLPREDFFRACGRNLWRFIRLLIIAAIIMVIFTGVLFAVNGAIVKKAGESTNELLPFELQMTGLAVIFLIMSTLRIWFDLAEADIVLNDQRAVRKSIAAGFRHAFHSLGSLLGSYVLTTIVAAIFLVVGLWLWMRVIPAQSVGRAFVLGQIILFVLLIPRFWQRGIAVSYWQQHMIAPVVAVNPAELPPAPVVVAPEPTPAPAPAPVVTAAPPETQGS